MPSVSMICIVNNREMYEGFLDSLNTQTCKDYELIPVMNMNNEYSSARKAYNDAAANASGRYLLFCHPDIRFLDEDALGDVVLQAKELTELDDTGVIGIAGAVPEGRYGRRILTAIVQGDGKESVGELIDKPCEVQTLDECLFIIGKDYFERMHFSEREGWHLYAAEYCLDAIRDGRRNYCVPARIWHMSDGKSLNEQYVLQVSALIEKEKDSFDLIATTVRAWKCRGASAAAYRRYYYIKQYVKNRVLHL